ncbi:MAG: hypothetical protein E7564_10745 [Ruminococcaceae bacterium]|nr:hypothetical protein [Oscillospiraceae bacterium]
MKFLAKIRNLFKKAEKPIEKAAVKITEPAVKYDFIRGVWAPSEPKYYNVNLITDYLKTLGFNDFKAVTKGETSSHHWTFAFSRTYESMEDFLLNSRKDFEEESMDNKHGPEIDWDSTLFTVVKHMEEGDLTMLMIVDESDNIGFNTKPREIKWILSFPASLKETELINKIISQANNL